MINRLNHFQHSPKKTKTLDDRDMVNALKKHDSPSLKKLTINELREKLADTERAIWMIDKKYGFKIEEAWNKYYELKKDIKDLENY